MDILTLVMLGLIVLLLLAVVWLVVMFVQLNKNQESLEKSMNQIKGRASENEEIRVSHTVGRNDTIKTDLAGLSKRIVDLESFVMQLRNKEERDSNFNEENQNQQQSQHELMPEQQVNRNHEEDQKVVKFVKNQGGGYLKECAEEGAHYKLTNVTETDADFALCANFDKVKSSPNDYLDSVAETYGERNSASECITRVPGHVVKENGRWKVVKTTKVEFK